MDDTGERLIPEGNTQTLTYGEHLSRYLSVGSLVGNKIVLDIASGAGYGTKLISQTAKKVYGVDYSIDAIKYAKKYYNAKNIEYIIGDAQAIPLADKSIDVVVSFETIEHLPSPKKFMQEVKRVLKTDGYLVVSTPNDDEFIEGNEFHLHEFKFKELKVLIHNNFKYNHFYYQGAYFSSALLDEKTYVRGGHWDGVVEKTFPQSSNKAIYYLAVASNAPVVELPNIVTLADAWSTKDDITRASQLNAQIEQFKSELVHWAEEYQKLSNEIKDIKISKAWKMIVLIRKARQHFRKN